MHRLQMWLISDPAMRASHDFIDNAPPCDSGNRRLTGRIHIRDHYPVRITEGTPEFTHPPFSSFEQGGRKHRNESPPSDRFCCAKRGTNFGWMMRIIVDE